jgi:Zn-dependent protease
MWRFKFLGFPVTVEIWFWLTCLLLGSGLAGRGRDGIMLMVVWTVVVFVSIMVHELGHAFAARKHGIQPAIRLQAFGGVTIMHSAHLTRGQSIFVSAAGPMASLALGGLVWLIDRAYPVPQGPALHAVIFFLWVNFFWTAINLLPVLPLDGGQIVRDLLGPRYRSVAIWLGVVCGVLVGVWAFTIGQLFLGIMMLLLAFSNFQGGRASGGVSRD